MVSNRQKKMGQNQKNHGMIKLELISICELKFCKDGDYDREGSNKNKILNITAFIILLLQPNDHKKEVQIQNIAFSRLHSLQWFWFFSCKALNDIFHIFVHTVHIHMFLLVRGMICFCRWHGESRALPVW